MKWYVRHLGALALALAGTAAAAQKPAPPEEAICVGGGRGWSASDAEVREIEAKPVPEAFRARFESAEPCVRWALSQRSLIDYHINFGSERSAAAALAYLEQDYRKAAPAPASYLDELARARRSAQPELRKTTAKPSSRGHRLQGLSPPNDRPALQRFCRLSHVREKYIFLAEEHLRAAEEFGSLPLLDRGAMWLRPATEGAKFLRRLEKQLPDCESLMPNLGEYLTDELSLREAVLRAELTRDEGEVARAEGLRRSLEQPEDPLLAMAAYSGGEDFCDIGDGVSRAERVRAACRDDDATSIRVTAWALAGARLDLVADGAHRESYDTALRLLQRESASPSGRCCYRDSRDDLVRLQSSRAAHYLRLFARNGASASRERAVHGEYRFQILEDLREAEKLIAPSTAPARFARIANKWLAVWRTGQGRDPDRSALPAELRRHAAYLQSVLEDLPAITTGATAKDR